MEKLGVRKSVDQSSEDCKRRTLPPRDADLLHVDGEGLAWMLAVVEDPEVDHDHTPPAGGHRKGRPHRAGVKGHPNRPPGLQTAFRLIGEEVDGIIVTGWHRTEEDGGSGTAGDSRVVCRDGQGPSGELRPTLP